MIDVAIQIRNPNSFPTQFRLLMLPDTLSAMLNTEKAYAKTLHLSNILVRS
jgi:hypothetical protein